MGLQQSIFGKAGTGFFRLGQAKFASGYRLYTKRGEQGTDLADLSSIMAGNDQPARFKFAVIHNAYL
jgi:hypothetical protein